MPVTEIHGIRTRSSLCLQMLWTLAVWLSMVFVIASGQYDAIIMAEKIWRTLRFPTIQISLNNWARKRFPACGSFWVMTYMPVCTIQHIPFPSIFCHVYIFPPVTKPSVQTLPASIPNTCPGLDQVHSNKHLRMTPLDSDRLAWYHQQQASYYVRDFDDNSQVDIVSPVSRQATTSNKFWFMAKLTLGNKR